MSWKGFKEFLKENKKGFLISSLIAWFGIIVINGFKYLRDNNPNPFNWTDHIIALPVSFGLCFIMMITVGSISGGFKE